MQRREDAKGAQKEKMLLTALRLHPHGSRPCVFGLSWRCIFEKYATMTSKEEER
jgi:hypothetical protein